MEIADEHGKRKLAPASSFLLWPLGYLIGPVSEFSMQKTTRTKMVTSLSHSNRSLARCGCLVHNPQLTVSWVVSGV